MTIKVLVAGAGSIGRRHLSNLRALGSEVCAWRERAALGSELAEEIGATVYVDLEEAISSVDAVVVATATDRHLHVAMTAARAGRAIFLEKPVANSWDGVAELMTTITEAEVVVEVGCQLRAHPNLIELSDRIASNSEGPLYTFRAAVGQRLEQWRPGSDYRQSYSASAARGGGALMDLIHEIDLVHWLGGGVVSVWAQLSTLSDQEISSDDLANLVVKTRTGAVGHIQMDMLSPTYRRSLELIFRDAVYIWDYVGGTLTRDNGKTSEVIHRVPAGFVRNDLFMTHMAHFLTRIRTPQTPALCSLEDGITALRVALAARESDRSGRPQLIAESFS